MGGTPLEAAEIEMMSVPHFGPRYSGPSLSYRYRPEDLECKYCTNYERKHPCRLTQCICLDERMETRAVTLEEFVWQRFAPTLPQKLKNRLLLYLALDGAHFFENEGHKARWNDWRNRFYRMSLPNKAALYLLSADTDLWRRLLWKCDENGFDYDSVKLAGVTTEQYSIYQAAKTISKKARSITLDDLGTKELVSDKAFQLIIGAMLITRYGERILRLEGGNPQ